MRLISENVKQHKIFYEPSIIQLGSAILENAAENDVAQFLYILDLVQANEIVFNFISYCTNRSFELIIKNKNLKQLLTKMPFCVLVSCLTGGSILDDKCFPTFPQIKEELKKQNKWIKILC